jgi:hypothetical protein
MFRLNQQEFRNNKYKKRDSAGLKNRGSSHTDPIDLDDGESPAFDPQMTPTLQPE